MFPLLPTQVRVACAMICAGIIFGAFGAHGLAGHVTPQRLGVFEKAVFYQLVSGLGLLATAALPESMFKNSIRYYSFVLIAMGAAIFSGSLYLLVLTDTPVLGAITPIGGTAMIVGWGLLVLVAEAKIINNINRLHSLG